MLFETLDSSGHEQVMFCHDRQAQLKAIIAIHNTTLGPALGGVRIRPYANAEQALGDALRLSRTMTYKNALAGLNFGGGKAVVIADPKADKSEVLLRALGRHIQTLGGRYIAAEDMGTDVADMEQIYLETAHVVGVHQVHGGSGDPAPFSAYGALQSLMTATERVLGHSELSKLTVAVQGLGHTGMEFVRLLDERGTQLYVADTDATRVQRAVEKYGCQVVEPEAIYDVPADVLAPCAMEAAINSATLERLKVKLICGTANNQLSSHAVGDELFRRSIAWVPDYAVNAGGVMNVSLEIDGYNRERALRLIRGIRHTINRIFDLSEQAGISPQRAADRLAESRIEAIGSMGMRLCQRPARDRRIHGE